LILCLHGKAQPLSAKNIEELFRPYDSRLAVIVGSGTSLRSFDFKQLAKNDIFTFAINHEPWRGAEHYRANALIYCDAALSAMHIDTPCPTCGGTFSNLEVDHIFTSREEVKRLELRGVEAECVLSKAYKFEVTRGSWSPGCGKAFMDRTTATAALSMAIEMGFKDIAMIGVDLYSEDEQYYYTGGKPSPFKRAGSTKLSDGRYMEDRHSGMLAAFLQVGNKLKVSNWDGNIYQCSKWSPLEIFNKVSFSEVIRRRSSPESVMARLEMKNGE